MNKENDIEKTIINSLADFIDFETNIICSSLLDEKFNDCSFFQNMYIYYGKNYEHGKSFAELKGKFGIYLFFINDGINLSYKEVFDFNDCASGAKFKDYSDINLTIGDCLYLGSSTSESLYTRMNQHFNDKIEPAALHLSLEKRKMLKNIVKIYAFPVPDKSIKNIDVLLKAIEKELHNLYEPLAGSNRT